MTWINAAACVLRLSQPRQKLDGQGRLGDSITLLASSRRDPADRGGIKLHFLGKAQWANRFGASTAKTEMQRRAQRTHADPRGKG